MSIEGCLRLVVELKTNFILGQAIVKNGSLVSPLHIFPDKNIEMEFCLLSKGDSVNSDGEMILFEVVKSYPQHDLMIGRVFGKNLVKENSPIEFDLSNMHSTKILASLIPNSIGKIELIKKECRFVKNILLPERAISTDTTACHRRNARFQLYTGWISKGMSGSLILNSENLSLAGIAIGNLLSDEKTFVGSSLREKLSRNY